MNVRLGDDALDSLLTKFRDTVRQIGLSVDKPIVCAVSGGLDSSVLLNLCRESWGTAEDIIVCHLDHQLRHDSGDDLNFVAALALENGCQFHSEQADVAVIARERKASVETVGRQIRYQFLQRIKDETGAQAVLTAHTRDDQMETVLLQLIRGTGLWGLRGIARATIDGIVRPLLETPRSDLERYAESNRLVYRHDSTNDDERYVRNRIRRRLIPILRDLGLANVDHHFSSIADDATSATQLIERYVGERLVRLDTKSIMIPCAVLEDKESSAFAVRVALKSLLGDIQQISRRHIRHVVSLMESTCRVVDLPRGLFAARVSEGIVIRRHDTYPPMSHWVERVLIPGETCITGVGILRTELKTQGNWKTVELGAQMIDRASIHGELFARSRLAGDRFRIVRSTGTKKLQDLFIDRKIPWAVRGRIPVCVDDSGILLVAGVAIADRAKVVSSSKEVVLLRWQPMESA